ncbi:MAG TPA: cupin domain-containing protein [Umezawaea sp.]|nr:cupin domain-containing protein [Umezawaea sp.]
MTDTRVRSVHVLRDVLSATGLDAVAWTRWEQPGRAGVEIHPLFTTGDPQNATAFLTRMGPGAHGDLHEHLGYELMFVLEGELVNDNGDRYGVGDLIVEEPGSVHQVTSVTGCTVLGVRSAPTRPLG